jgi:hypothetical protein
MFLRTLSHPATEENPLSILRNTQAVNMARTAHKAHSDGSMDEETECVNEASEVLLVFMAGWKRSEDGGALRLYLDSQHYHGRRKEICNYVDVNPGSRASVDFDSTLGTFCER